MNTFRPWSGLESLECDWVVTALQIRADASSLLWNDSCVRSCQQLKVRYAKTTHMNTLEVFIVKPQI